MKKQRYVLNTLIFLGILTLAGCGNSTSKEDSLVTLESDSKRNITPNSTQSEVQTLANNNNQFAFKIFEVLSFEENGNIFFSPYSISEALAISYIGTDTDTKYEMGSTLNFDSVSDDQLNDSFNALNLHLSNNDNNYTFDINNDLWVQKDYPILESYLDTIKVNYGANVKTLDFTKDTENSRVTINNYVEEKTFGRIQDILQEGDITNLTQVVLTNTIYFKAEWLNKFMIYDTRYNTFISEDKSENQISFMNQYDANYKYIQEDAYQAIELPYKNSDSSMLIILPNEDELSNIMFDMEDIYQAIDNMQYERINLKMPKFKFSSPLYDMKSYFQSLGMITPFTANADFSNMTSNDNLYISSINHKAFIEIDEEGTEAAAATTVVDSNTSAPESIIDFNINRPFVFFIKDNVTKQILFMGVIKTL